MATDIKTSAPETDKDHYCTDEVVCPYCGLEYSESYEFFDRNNHSSVRHTCDDCGREFEIERDFSVTYSTSPIDHEKEALKKRIEDERILERYLACQRFKPGARVRVLDDVSRYMNRKGHEGVVANRELSRRNPFVHVVFDVDRRDNFFLPHELELLPEPRRPR